VAIQMAETSSRGRRMALSGLRERFSLTETLVQLKYSK
jgi:hypothetical protein